MVPEGIGSSPWAGCRWGRVDVLADIADAVGLDGDEIRSAAGDEDRRERFQSEFVEARNAKSSGAPTFRYDGRTARGAVPPEQLERLVEGV